MKTAKILVIDDEQAVLEALPDLLHRHLYRVYVEGADSGYQALEAAGRVDYDVILSDLRISDVKELELIRQLHDLRPRTPLILMTGHRDDNVVQAAIALGVFAILDKPLDRHLLLREVRAALKARIMSITPDLRDHLSD
ncbi:response regulator [Nitrospira sp. Nam74]